MAAVYTPLPPDQARELGLEVQSSKRSAAFVGALLRRCVPGMPSPEEFVERKAVVLEHNYKKRRQRKHSKAKGLTARERREMKIFHIRAEQQKYAMFLPLHDLWLQYIRDLCNGLKPGAQPQMVQTRMLKADLHGALVSVFKSKCPSYVGITGIILQETKLVFKIITKEDKLKVVPKLNCVFSLEVDGFITFLYGSKLQMRASERSARKFKAKGSIDL